MYWKIRPPPTTPFPPQGSRDLPQQGFCTPRPKGNRDNSLQKKVVRNIRSIHICKEQNCCQTPQFATKFSRKTICKKMQNICLESQFAESLTIDPEGLVAKRCPEQQFAKLAKCAAGWSRYRKFVQNNILQKKKAWLCLLMCFNSFNFDCCFWNRFRWFWCLMFWKMLMLNPTIHLAPENPFSSSRFASS